METIIQGKAMDTLEATIINGMNDRIGQIIGRIMAQIPIEIITTHDGNREMCAIIDMLLSFVVLFLQI